MNKSCIHIALGVADVDRSVAFYRSLLGRAPARRRPGYAKFESEQPPVHLALIEEPGRARPASRASHFGIRVASSAEVWSAARRLRDLGMRTRTEEGVTCCYAVQDKVWVEDPDGHPWEVYAVLEADAAQDGACCPGGDEACCGLDPEEARA